MPALSLPLYTGILMYCIYGLWQLPSSDKSKCDTHSRTATVSPVPFPGQHPLPPPAGTRYPRRPLAPCWPHCGATRHPTRHLGASLFSSSPPRLHPPIRWVIVISGRCTPHANPVTIVSLYFVRKLLSRHQVIQYTRFCSYIFQIVCAFSTPVSYSS